MWQESWKSAGVVLFAVLFTPLALYWLGQLVWAYFVLFVGNLVGVAALTIMLWAYARNNSPWAFSDASNPA